MKVLKSYVALAAGALVALSSCSEGQYWNEPSDKGQVIAFPKPTASIQLQPTQSAPDSYTVTISRTDNRGALDVQIVNKSSNPDVLTGPSSVSFADGSYTADYVISIGDIEPGVVYADTISVVQPETNSIIHPDAKNMQFIFNLTQVLSWSVLTKDAIYYDNLVANIYGAAAFANFPVKVTVEKCDNFDGYYRIVEPFADFKQYGLGVAKGGYILIDARDPEHIFVPLSDTGMIDGDNTIEIETISTYFMDNGKPASALPAIYWGTMKDDVISFAPFNGAAPNSNFIFFSGSDGPYLCDVQFTLDLSPDAPAQVSKPNKSIKDALIANPAPFIMK